MKAPAEGVAAPLEPSRQEFAANLEHEWLDQQSILDFRNWLIEKLWTEAAVSKNLEEERKEFLGQLRESLGLPDDRAWFGQGLLAVAENRRNRLQAAESRILELEKQITALRETK